MVKYNGEANFKKLILEEFEGCPICLGDESENATRVSLEYKASIDGFLDAAQQFNEDFKEEIEKEKKEYLKKQGMYI